MFADSREAAAWIMVVLSVLLAIALPVVAHRNLRRPGAVRQMWLYSKPGRVVSGCVVALIMLSASGIFMVALSTVYWFLSATVVLIVGAMVAVGILLVRFLTHDTRDLL